jgi:hypothetical protein
MKFNGLNRHYSHFSNKLVALFAAGALTLILILLAGCSASSATFGTAAPDYDAARNAAVTYCQNKYGFTPDLVNDQYHTDGIDTAAAADGTESISVEVSAGGQIFNVDVIGEEGTADSYQAAEISQAIANAAAQALQVDFIDFQVVDQPGAYLEYFDGENLEEVLAGASDITCYFACSDANSAQAALPAYVSKVHLLNVTSQDTWQAALDQAENVSWALHYECTLPYLQSVTTIERNAGGAVTSTEFECNQNTVAYFDGPLMSKYVTATPYTGDAQLNGYTSSVLFGDAYYCESSAQPTLDAGALLVFIDEDSWESLTSGYSQVGYRIVDSAATPIKIGANGQMDSANTYDNSNVFQFGAYHVIYLPPGAIVTLYGSHITE